MRNGIPHQYRHFLTTAPCHYTDKIRPHTQRREFCNSSLHCITAYVEETDLSALRHVNRAVETTAFKEYANAFLEKLACYPLDDARLDRIHNILSLPRFAKCVRLVRFDTTPEVRFEKEIPVAANSNQSRKDAQLEAYNTLLRENAASTRMNVPNRPLIRAILSRLENAVCGVALAMMHPDRSMMRGVYRDLLEEMAVAVRSIDFFGLTGAELVARSRYALPLKLPDTSSVTSLKSLAIPIKRDAAPVEGVGRMRNGVLRAVEAARGVRELSFETSFHTGFDAFSNQFLDAYNSTALSCVTLRSMIPQTTSLAAFLKRHGDGLERSDSVRSC